VSADKWVCTEHRCGWVGTEFLSAPNPFDPDGGEIVGCPQCKGISTLVAACHHEGCNEQANCGEKWPDGVYRWSCYGHSLFASLHTKRYKWSAT
jgi:hypothetical protein